jgi:hypothetical protein
MHAQVDSVCCGCLERRQGVNLALAHGTLGPQLQVIYQQEQSRKRALTRGKRGTPGTPSPKCS